MLWDSTCTHLAQQSGQETESSTVVARGDGKRVYWVRASVAPGEGVLGLGSGDGSTATGMDLVPLRCTLKKG